MSEVAVKYSNTKLKNLKNISTVNDFLENIFSNCSEDILYNYNLIHDFYDPESLHQFRISLRKFKSFLQFFKDEINAIERKKANKLIQELLAPTSKIRDLDVIRENYLSSSFFNNTNNSEFDLLQEYTNDSQNQLHKSTLEILLSNQYLDLLNKLIKWADNRKWRVNLKLNQLDTLEKIPNKIINKRFHKQYKNITKENKNVLFFTQNELHRFRIRTKTLRYVISELGFLIKHHKKMLEDLKLIQDLLGKINDTYVVEHLIEDFSQNIDIDKTKKYIRNKADNLRNKYLVELNKIN